MTKEKAYQIGWRVARGLTLKQALLLENVTSEQYEEAMSDETLQHEYDLASAEFMEKAIQFIEKADIKESKGIQWLLSRRHVSQFGTQPETVITNQQITINGVDKNIVEQLRNAASQAARNKRIES
jgi:hypothetical protein